MADNKPAKSGGVMACIFGSLGVLSDALIASFVPSERLGLAVAVANVGVALLTWFLYLIYCVVARDPDLLAYEASLKRDIKRIRKSMAAPDISSEAKQRLQNALDEAHERYAAAERDFNSGAVKVKVANFDGR